MNIRELEIPVSITQPLPDGQVRYTKTTYVGDVSNDITVEGSVDDVLRIIKDDPEKNNSKHYSKCRSMCENRRSC
ncbi:hypothetical protein FC756_16090 [Lysinibacillus mangiferihumi]|uniref:Uncharacterized protein n=1 Tax=Lysinibacillus mangiferihumi TaxID=1130819 RepID=A0A4U2YVM1_9BACI|nr:hypothetical protein [Lysinibacillus mangiferihumi]TKI65569.1 hypothetical protein FC756_16090 [Lysinibacillus mangiferihumi]